MALNLFKKGKKFTCTRCGFKEEKVYKDKNGDLICDYCKNGNDPLKRTK